MGFVHIGLAQTSPKKNKRCASLIAYFCTVFYWFLMQHCLIVAAFFKGCSFDKKTNNIFLSVRSNQSHLCMHQFSWQQSYVDAINSWQVCQKKLCFVLFVFCHYQRQLEHLCSEFLRYSFLQGAKGEVEYGKE